MRLLVASHTPHYKKGERIVGWGPTVREIDHLATLFHEVVHVAPLHDGAPPESAIPYESSRVILASVPAAGGSRLADKVRVLRASPVYIRTLLKEIRASDVVHVRCPASISLLAVLILGLSRRPEKRWIKYAGNWRPGREEPWSYALQRFLLSRTLHQAVVTVNGSWPGQPDHVRSFLNPCLTDEELREGAAVAAAKELSSPLRLLFVGRLEEEKGCGRAVEILARLKQLGVPASLDVVGDGPDRALFETGMREAGLCKDVRFLGWLPRHGLAELYAGAHFLVHPSMTSEGWPKVISEGMAYGVIPVTSSVSSIPQYLQRFQTGRALDPTRPQGFVDALAWYVSHRTDWKTESLRAIAAAPQFTYSQYVSSVRRLLALDSA